MKSKKLKIALGIVLVPLIYWNATAAMIENSARYLSTSHGCIVWIPFPHTSFLTLMGWRSVPALRRQIADPNVGLSSKIYMAWTLEKIGDDSQFPIFIDGLRSKRSQYIAAARMADFPVVCQRHLPEILAVGRQKWGDDYWKLLSSLAHQNDVPDEKIEAIAEIMGDAQAKNRGFSDREIQQLRQNFAARTERKSLYWATGITSDKNSSNASRQ